MKTSYFANFRNVSHPVAISAKIPDWYLGHHYKKLAPTFDLLMGYKRKEIDELEYTQEYITRVLDHLDPVKTYNQLINLGGGDATLLCYERPNEFCHRRIVAIWFEQTIPGVLIPELYIKE